MKKQIICLLITFFGCQFTFLNAQRIERVEPPNWWVGMKHNTVQVLVYGEDISQWEPSVENPDIQLKKTTRVNNPNYMFLDLFISEKADATTVNIDFYKEKKKVGSHQYPLLERDMTIPRKGFDSSDVMYLITPDRFANGDPSNDVIPGMKEKVVNRQDEQGRHGGDIKGIKDRLDYIHDLGFTAIWLNPILENDMYRTSYHGYAATDFYKVDQRFGTNEDYVQFCQEAQKKGIKIIMDMILNHNGSEHWFVKDPPTKDWINHNNSYVQTSHRRTTHQDPYASEYDKKAFVDGWFVKTMPDLNQKQPLMANYLIQNTLWWIEYTGIAGIRMDTYPYPDKEFMTQWNDAILAEYPAFNIVGEEWSLNPAVVSFWQAGKTNSNGYRSSLTSVMDFPLQDALISALVEEENWNSGWIKVYEMLGNDHLYPDPQNLVIFPDNHDMDRVLTQLKGDIDLLKMAMIYFSTMRGVPQFYYGTEIGMKNDQPGHGQIRADFPGGWSGDTVNGFSGKGLSPIEKDMKSFTSKLLNWRKKNTLIHSGKLIQFAPENGIYTYFRYNEEETIMVIFNKNKEAIKHDLSKYKEMIGTNSQATEIFQGKKYSLSDSLMLNARNGMILVLEK
ncbi:MAG: glycoside hydrolase family 13 protein [Flavobacteriaceae bacterium]|nr:glycoside hydrolase family 13 protein [Flavobacteriaceae bacterium]